MISVRVLTLILLLPLVARAQEDCAEIKVLETKAMEDISKYMRKAKSGSECSSVFDKIDARYLELSTLVYKEYREYLNKFLTDYTSDAKEVKAMQSMVDHFRQGKGQELINANSTKRNNESETALLNYLIANYKEQSSNPPVLQNCEFTPVMDKKSKKKVLPKMNNDLLISREPKMDDKNVCTQVQPGIGYPSYQRTLRFQVKEGRAMVWYCNQKFGTNLDGSLTEVKANCMAYDLQSNKPILGDQRQSHVYGGDKPFEINDYRLHLAKSHGYVPLTFSEFLNKNGGVLNDPRLMYNKAPKYCMESKDFLERSEKARRALSEIEKTSGYIEL